MNGDDVLTSKIGEITQRENALYRYWGGRIPEANADLNDLQREKISAIYENYGSAYVGKINHYGAERETLTADTVFVEYTGQTICNFEADFILPVADVALAEMIIQWNNGGLPLSLNLIGRIIRRVDELGGANLIWS